MENTYDSLYGVQCDVAYTLAKFLKKEKLKKKKFAKLCGLNKKKIKSILKHKAVLKFDELNRISNAMNKNFRLVFFVKDFSVNTGLSGYTSSHYIGFMEEE